MVFTLNSRWGLESVVVAAAGSGDERSPLPADETSTDRSTTAKTAVTATPFSATTVVTAIQPSDLDCGEEDDEPTGRALWDCAQVLWDLVADPHPDNQFTVRGKVRLL